VIVKFLNWGTDLTFFALVLAWLVMLILGGWFSFSESLWLQLLSILIFGLGFAHGVELQHQTLHHSGFRSKRANRLCGCVLGLPMLISFTLYRKRHLEHHAYLGTPKNKEFFDYSTQYGVNTVRDILIRFSLIYHYRDLSRNFNRFFRRMPTLENLSTLLNRRIWTEHVCMCLVILGLSLLSFLMHDYRLILNWIAALFFVAGPVHALIEMPEHFECDLTSRDMFKNTRSITSGAIACWFTNYNNLHVEHHMYPSIPLQQLRAIHLKQKSKILFYEPTYITFFRKYLVRRIGSSHDY
jgi:fatty acid desaturase